MAKLASSAARNASRLHNFWRCLHLLQLRAPSVDVVIFKFRPVSVYVLFVIYRTNNISQRGKRKGNASEHSWCIYLLAVAQFATLDTEAASVKSNVREV